MKYLIRALAIFFLVCNTVVVSLKIACNAPAVKMIPKVREQFISHMYWTIYITNTNKRDWDFLIPDGNLSTGYKFQQNDTELAIVVSAGPGIYAQTTYDFVVDDKKAIFAQKSYPENGFKFALCSMKYTNSFVFVSCDKSFAWVQGDVAYKLWEIPDAIKALAAECME